MKRCDIHNHTLVFVENTVNGDPWVCAQCAYTTALSLSRQLAAVEAQVAELKRALDLTHKAWEADKLLAAQG